MSFSYEQHPQVPRYAEVGDYIVTLDQIHGLMISKADSKDFPYQVFITYRYVDGTMHTVALEMASKELALESKKKIAGHIGAV